MKSALKKVLLIMPSKIVARGIESVLGELGEFRVEGILTDLSRTSESHLKNMDVDVIIIDPCVFDYVSRGSGRSRIAEYSDAAVVALQTIPMNAEDFKPYDGTVNIFDDPVTVVRKLREACSSHHENPDAESHDLSAREKEILVCVAKGMLNKEIADVCNLSIHTVITHRKNITRKTGIKTVAGLTVYALLHNLIDSNSIELE
ncbi:MAG: response regulator transcription factor [Bacteroidales bacterium]|nr:response regulator transcription factor [Bacteroidales bacterium]MBQ8856462.1 response regulator transcription factor [Bacteroidales bacterium]